MLFTSARAFFRSAFSSCRLQLRVFREQFFWNFLLLRLRVCSKSQLSLSVVDSIFCALSLSLQQKRCEGPRNLKITQQPPLSDLSSSYCRGSQKSGWPKHNHNHNFREEKNNINIDFLVQNFLRRFLTLMPGWPGVKKFLPITGAAGKRTFWCGRPRFSVRTSITWRVLEKLCPEKVCVDSLAPIIFLWNIASDVVSSR